MYRFLSCMDRTNERRQIYLLLADALDDIFAANAALRVVTSI